MEESQENKSFRRSPEGRASRMHLGCGFFDWRSLPFWLVLKGKNSKETDAFPGLEWGASSFFGQTRVSFTTRAVDMPISVIQPKLPPKD